MVDKSEFGSPLQISGNISFFGQITGNSVSSSSDYTLTARNVSGKEVIFLLVRFSEMGPRAGGTLHNYQWDKFFRDEGLAPGTVFVLDRSHGGIDAKWQPELRCNTYQDISHDEGASDRFGPSGRAEARLVRNKC